MPVELKIFVIGLIIDFHVSLVWLAIKLINNKFKETFVEKKSETEKTLLLETASRFAPNLREMNTFSNCSVEPVSHSTVLPDMKVETSFANKKLGNTKIVDD